MSKTAKKTFMVYCPDMGQGPDDARKIQADDAEEAAEKFHEQINVDDFTHTLKVIVVGHGEYKSFAEYTVIYSAEEAE